MTVRSVAAALALSAALAPAMAQTFADQAIGDFVDSHSATTHLRKIARWEDPICPQVTGLPANFTKFIAKRVRDVAASVGAPVDPAGETCTSNIEIVFTMTPQDLLNSIREKQPIMLGYYDNTDQANERAQVTHVIQSWHATQTVDLRGNKVIDSRNPIRLNPSSSNLVASTGLRTGDGVRSTYFRGVVVANPGKLVDVEIGALADHIAMLALAQPAKFGPCTELPSILDMTDPACRKEAPVKALTKADTGYLTGLYKMDSGLSLRGQKDHIALRVREALAAP